MSRGSENRFALLGYLGWKVDTVYHHWTSLGVITLSVRILAGDPWFNLAIGDRSLQNYARPSSAVASIAAGDHDTADLPLSKLGIPDDYKKWNGFK